LLLRLKGRWVDYTVGSVVVVLTGEINGLVDVAVRWFVGEMFEALRWVYVSGLERFC
jgi:hypothetical protein